MKNNHWIIITLVVAFLGFMIGYSVPPFLEVGFTSDGHGGGAESGGTVDQDIMKQYQKLYETDE